MKQIANQAKAGVRRQTEKCNHNFGAPKALKQPLTQKRPTVVSRAIEREKEPIEEKKGRKYDDVEDDDSDSDKVSSDEDDDAYSLKSSYDAEVASKHMENAPASLAKLNRIHQ